MCVCVCVCVFVCVCTYRVIFYGYGQITGYFECPTTDVFRAIGNLPNVSYRSCYTKASHVKILITRPTTMISVYNRDHQDA